MSIFDYEKIPAEALLDIDCYVKEKKMPGGFLTAVLENDLLKAVDRADEYNLRIIPIYVTYLYNKIPMDAWGSKETVRKWTQQEEK